MIVLTLWLAAGWWIRLFRNRCLPKQIFDLPSCGGVCAIAGEQMPTGEDRRKQGRRNAVPLCQFCHFRHRIGIAFDIVIDDTYSLPALRQFCKKPLGITTVLAAQTDVRVDCEKFLYAGRLLCVAAKADPELITRITGWQKRFFHTKPLHDPPIFRQRFLVVSDIDDLQANPAAASARVSAYCTASRQTCESPRMKSCKRRHRSAGLANGCCQAWAFRATSVSITVFSAAAANASHSGRAIALMMTTHRRSSMPAGIDPCISLLLSQRPPYHGPMCHQRGKLLFGFSMLPTVPTMLFGRLPMGLDQRVVWHDIIALDMLAQRVFVPSSCWS